LFALGLILCLPEKKRVNLFLNNEKDT